MLFLFVPILIIAAFAVYTIIRLATREHPFSFTDFTTHTKTTHKFDMNAKPGAGWNRPRDKNNPTDITSHLV